MGTSRKAQLIRAGVPSLRWICVRMSCSHGLPFLLTTCGRRSGGCGRKWTSGPTAWGPAKTWPRGVESEVRAGECLPSSICLGGRASGKQLLSKQAGGLVQHLVPGTQPSLAGTHTEDHHTRWGLLRASFRTHCPLHPISKGNRWAGALRCLQPSQKQNGLPASPHPEGASRCPPPLAWPAERRAHRPFWDTAQPELARWKSTCRVRKRPSEGLNPLSQTRHLHCVAPFLLNIAILGQKKCDRLGQSL